MLAEGLGSPSPDQAKEAQGGERLLKLQKDKPAGAEYPATASPWLHLHFNQAPNQKTLHHAPVAVPRRVSFISTPQPSRSTPTKASCTQAGYRHEHPSQCSWALLGWLAGLFRLGQGYQSPWHATQYPKPLQSTLPPGQPRQAAQKQAPRQPWKCEQKLRAGVGGRHMRHGVETPRESTKHACAS